MSIRCLFCALALAALAPLAFGQNAPTLDQPLGTTSKNYRLETVPGIDPNAGDIAAPVAVPEPTVIALVLTGGLAGGLMMVRRRRSR